MKNYLFVGGDERQKFAAEYIKKQVNTVSFAYTFDELKKEIPQADIIVLPLPVTRDGKHINSDPKNGLISIEELIFLLKEGMTIMAGMINSDTAQRIESKGVALYDYYQSEVLTILNSVSTAEGVIYELIGNSKINLQGSKSLVTGYGKASSAICKLLYSLGSEVVVSARSERDRIVAAAHNCKAIALYDISENSDGLDFVINTVPALVIDEKVICRLKKDCFILDIASAPYGTDFEAAEKYGITAKKAPSLPGRISPRSAGEAIAKTILGIEKGEVSLK